MLTFNLVCLLPKLSLVVVAFILSQLVLVIQCQPHESSAPWSSSSSPPLPPPPPTAAEAIAYDEPTENLAHLPGLNWLTTNDDDAELNQKFPHLSNITELLINKFRYLFGGEGEQEGKSLSPGERGQQDFVTREQDNDGQHAFLTEVFLANESQPQQQSVLENRKIDQEVRSHGLSQHMSGAQLAPDAGQVVNRRNYFKVLNKVFSRVDLPEVYKARNLPRGGYCAQHIGCVEEIPNFPSILKKSNVSSTYTLYNRDTGHKNGHKILFDPIVHYQLQDANTSEIELHEKLKQQYQFFLKEQQQLQQQQQLQLQLPLVQPGGNVPNLLGRPNIGQQQTSFNNRQRQTASSWRTAAKIIYSQEYPFDLSSLEQAGFNSSLNTRIIVGGYFAKEDEEWIDEVVKQWLLLESCNIIKVSWAEANRGLYHTAAYNSRIVARQLTLFLHYLDQLFQIDLGKFHLVGHSLGAHIAGYVGADYDGKIARITGLDPAGPIFLELNTSMRLDPSDAKYVDVVHTNGGSITKGALGLSIPSGHVDYYCNGGSVQPGCYFSSVTKSIMDPVERVACNHRRSYRYFIEIIKIAISEVPKQEDDEQGGESQSTQFTNRDISSSSSLVEGTSNKKAFTSQLPSAFLFEARHDDLVKLMQPELVMMSGQMRREITDSAPLKKRLEFHLLNPEFPSGKKGMYLFRTRSESPFFSSKQYALTIKTDNIVRRKIALMAKIDQTLVAEAELDEIPGFYTLAFVPNDPKVVNISDSSFRVPQLSLMWKPRSFNLLLNQQNELHLNALELSLLDSGDDEQLVIKYSLTGLSSPPPSSSPSASSSAASSISSLLPSASALTLSSLSTASGRGELSLLRNQWYKFEGRLLRSFNVAS